MPKKEAVETGYVMGLPYQYRIHYGARTTIAALMVAGGIWALSLYIHSDINTINPVPLFCLGMDFASLGTVIMLFVVASMSRSEPDNSTPLFFALLVIDYLALLLYIIGWLVEGQPEWRNVNGVTNMVSFLITPASCLVFWNYQRSLYPKDPKWDSYFTRLLTGMLVCNYLYVFIGSATGYLFTVDANGRYISGEGFPYAMIYPMFALVVCLVANMRRDIPTRKRVALVVFCCTPMITAISTLFITEYTYTHVMVLYTLLLTYGTVQTEKDIELTHKREELLRSEQQIMLSQIQPHFLYNALTAIRSLCEEDAEQACEALDQFSSYLRTNMDSLQNSGPVSFQKELEHAKTYLWIEQMRFEEDLRVEFDIQYTDFTLPPLTLQPLAENAVRHGICRMEYGGTVIVASRREGNTAVVTVTDDGVGFDPAAPLPEDDRSHVGLANVGNRLRDICGGTLTIHSIPGKGTVARITLPLREEEHP